MSLRLKSTFIGWDRDTADERSYLVLVTAVVDIDGPSAIPLVVPSLQRPLQGALTCRTVTERKLAVGIVILLSIGETCPRHGGWRVEFFDESEEDWFVLPEVYSRL